MVHQTLILLKKKYRVYEKLDIKEKLKSLNFNQVVDSEPPKADSKAMGLSFADFMA